jgi:hypothetical protein
MFVPIGTPRSTLAVSITRCPSSIDAGMMSMPRGATPCRASPTWSNFASWHGRRDALPGFADLVELRVVARALEPLRRHAIRNPATQMRTPLVEDDESRFEHRECVIRINAARVFGGVGGELGHVATGEGDVEGLGSVCEVATHVGDRAGVDAASERSVGGSGRLCSPLPRLRMARATAGRNEGGDARKRGGEKPPPLPLDGHGRRA